MLSKVVFSWQHWCPLGLKASKHPRSFSGVWWQQENIWHFQTINFILKFQLHRKYPGNVITGEILGHCTVVNINKDIFPTGS